MTDENEAPNDELAPINGTAVSTGVGVAAIALNLALKFYGINTVQDGTLYQQYKIEGREMRPFDLADVFDVAIKMEQHLLSGNERIAEMVVECIEAGLVEEEPRHD